MSKEILKSTNDRLDDHNNLTAVRWGLAGAVALAHAFEVCGLKDPLGIYNWQSSDLAVNGFFILSGLLITRSLSRNASILNYTRARALRLLPALFISLTATMLFFGPVFSSTGSRLFLTDPDAWAWLFRTLTLQDPRGAVALIFNDNPMAHINAPLWTIRHEIAAYAIAWIGYVSGWIRGKNRALIAFTFFSIVSLTELHTNTSFLPKSGYDLARLLSAFSFGLVLFYIPDLRKVRLRHVAIITLFFVLTGRAWIAEPIANFWLAISIMYVGLCVQLPKWIERIPDYSYGIYIWHFPIFQALYFSDVTRNPIMLLLIGTPIYLFVSGLSWHYIEKPALSLKRKSYVSGGSGLNV